MDQELLMSGASVKRGEESTDTIGALTHAILHLCVLPFMMFTTAFVLSIVGVEVQRHTDNPR